VVPRLVEGEPRNPDSGCALIAPEIQIQVRRVVIEVDSLSGISPYALKSTGTFSIQASNKGTRYTNKLSYSVLSGPGTVDANGVIVVAAVDPGFPPALMVIRILSEDPMAFQDVHFVVVP
jgi:hypothetical protein